ncbi:MAG TPA: protein kinase [Frankiaceae bacterium]|nr:protein kinase [Frankiaceae bacterium]
MALAPLRPTDPPAYGPYRLQGRLGAGGMGVVYLAFGPDNKPVALKVLQPVLAEDAEYRARFVREVGAARLVASPYVAKVVAAETDAAPLWMATEYVEGATLAHAVEMNGPVPSDRVHGLASDLAEALATLHDAGVVHRDLKPANVVLAWSGPKLIDFGIAKHEGTTDLTQTGVTVGSLLWMSPEVLGGQSAARPSDIFAWGLCLAYAGNGRPPFGAGNASAVAYRISSEQPDLHGLPGGLTHLVAASLSKDPRSRPSAHDLSNSLRGHGAQHFTAVAMPRAEGGWTGPTPTAVLPAPGAGGPTRAEPSPPPPPRRRRGRALVLPLAILAVLLAAVAVVLALVATSDDGKNNAKPPTPSNSTSTTPSASASASARASTSAPPSTSAPTSAPALASLTSAEATVMADDYTPYEDAAEFWDPTAPINVILGTFTNSGDGYNNWAFFFAGGQYIGHDTTSPSMAVSIQGRTRSVITLSYTIYGPSDPTCCPTGGMQTVRYQWDGKKLTPLDPIPTDDPAGNHR